MSGKTECHKCEYAENLHGCASMHVEEARRMISEGKFEEADRQLYSLEKHLKNSFTSIFFRYLCAEG